jgi:hypothetical protein
MRLRGLAVLLALALPLLYGCGGPDTESQPEDEPVARASVAGRWEATETSRGGIGAVLDLGEDGTFVGGLAVQVQTRYVIEEVQDRVMLRYPDDEEELPAMEVVFHGDTMEFKVDEDTLREMAGGEEMDAMDAPKIVKERVGGPTHGASPIVGVWTSDIHTGSRAFERFHADGHADFRLAMPGESRGTWSAQDGVLVLRSDGKAQEYEALLDGDSLTLTPKDGDADRSRTYRRTERWYGFPRSE